MNSTSFLPDNKPVISSVLVRFLYSLEDMEKIANGADPALFLPAADSKTNWGLLYLGEEEMGLFVHAYTPPVIALFNAGPNAEPAKAVYLHIPYNQVKSAEILRPEPPNTTINKIIAFFTCREEDRCILQWNETYRMEFFISTDSTEFEKNLKHFTGI